MTSIFRKPFAIGAAAGIIVFLQGLVVLRSPAGAFDAVEWWGLAWAGVFGLTLSSTFADLGQAMLSLSFACAALMLYYGTGVHFLALAYRRRRKAGAAAGLLLMLAIHVGLYLWVVRSVVA